MVERAVLQVVQVLAGRVEQAGQVLAGQAEQAEQVLVVLAVPVLVGRVVVVLAVQVLAGRVVQQKVLPGVLLEALACQTP